MLKILIKPMMIFGRWVNWGIFGIGVKVDYFVFLIKKGSKKFGLNLKLGFFLEISPEIY